MNRKKNRFEIAVEQVARFLAPIGANHPVRPSLEFPRRIESIASAALSRTKLDFISRPGLSDAVIGEVLRREFKHSAPTFHTPEVLMGCAVVLRARCIIFSSPDFGGPTERFTKAHEVGHLALDLNKHIANVNQISLLQTEAEHIITRPRDLPGMIPMDGGRFTPLPKEELNANAFAAELLMPLEDVRARVATIDDEHECVNTIMRTYGVSKTAARVRLKSIGRLSADESAMALFELASDDITKGSKGGR